VERLFEWLRDASLAEMTENKLTTEYITDISALRIHTYTSTSLSTKLAGIQQRTHTA